MRLWYSAMGTTRTLRPSQLSGAVRCDAAATVARLRRAREPNRWMLRHMSMRSLWWVPLLLLAACGGPTSQGDALGSGAAPAALHPAAPQPPVKTEAPEKAARTTMTVGEERSFPAELVDGRAPHITVCGTYGLAEPNTRAVLVPVDDSPTQDRFRAVAVGKVDLCSLPVQAVEACRKAPCVDHMGDLSYLTTVAVQENSAKS